MVYIVGRKINSWVHMETKVDSPFIPDRVIRRCSRGVEVAECLVPSDNKPMIYLHPP